jgi:ectoine hydroxylase-related dioxygenase (phytanoyl-CoA dioxygenase family)
MPRLLNEEEVKNFHKDGDVIMRKFFSDEEIIKPYKTAKFNSVIKESALHLNDRGGNRTKLTLWFTPADDFYSLLIRSNFMVNSVAKLLDSDSPVCHLRAKQMQKESRAGGAWEWYQDDGHWYKNQFLFPEQFVSIRIALTVANKQNGYLQVLKGSHKPVRVNHGFAGEQVGADMEMVNHALKTMPLVHVELQPGDALFFHSNILHGSEANLSEKPRWSLISCYNSRSNPACNNDSAGWKEPVEIVADDLLLKSENKGASLAGDFLKKEKDPALKETRWQKEVKTN